MYVINIFLKGFRKLNKKKFTLEKISVTRELRNYLRAYGIFIFRNGKYIAENLINIITASEYYEWTEVEINEKLKISKIFHSQ